jgi:hypothetical protein
LRSRRGGEGRSRGVGTGGRASRRSQPQYSAEDLMQAALFTPLLWPGRTIRLERNSLLDYRNRSTSGQQSPAEIYHENSKLCPRILTELVISAADEAQVRREYLRRRAAVAASSPRVEAAGPWPDLLRPIAESSLPLFYAVELRLLVGDLLLVYEPAANSCQLAKRLTAAESELLDAALSLLQAGGRPEEDQAVALVLGCFARNDLLLGPRGYRRTLLEAGQMAQELLRQAERSGLGAEVVYEFTDRDVDLVLEADGIEQSTLLAVRLGGSRGRP